MFRFFLIAFFLFAVIISINIIIYMNKDYKEFFIRNKGKITSIEEKLYSDSQNLSKYSIKIENNRNYKINCYLRKPKSGKKKYPAFILLGGLVTGKDVIDLVGDVSYADSVIFLSMDYVYEGKKKFKGLEILGSLGKIRWAVFNSISGILVLTDYLCSRKDIDKSRIFLAGVSFGGFFSTTDGGIDDRIKAVISVYSGGDIKNLLIYSLIRDQHIKGKTINKILGSFGAFLIKPAEPLLYVDKISPRPLLIISGKKDERIPPRFVKKLYDRAKAPKDIIWLETNHIHPTKSEITQKITEIIMNWFLEKKLI